MARLQTYTTARMGRHPQASDAQWGPSCGVGNLEGREEYDRK